MVLWDAGNRRVRGGGGGGGGVGKGWFRRV